MKILDKIPVGAIFYMQEEDKESTIKYYKTYNNNLIISKDNCIIMFENKNLKLLGTEAISLYIEQIEKQLHG